jgi:tetrahydromethanopterin S-methyltransferase subunit G
LVINKNGLDNTNIVPKVFVTRKDAHNERTQRQDEIERRFVG